MLKIRMQGTKEDIRWFCEFLKENPYIEVLTISDMYSNKGTSKYFRLYAEIESKELKEDERHV